MNPTLIALAVSGLLFVAMLLFMYLGYRIGRWHKTSSPEASGAGSGGSAAVDAAVFGLLGLILAFTYASAASRLDTRRAQIVLEANAIGTAYLRVDLLPASEQPIMRQLFRQYLDSRIEVYARLPDLAAAYAEIARGASLQRQIWSRATAVCQAEAKTASCILVLPALNAMIDMATTRTMAAQAHAPQLILVLLVSLSLLGALLAGYAMSSQARLCLLHIILFALAVSIAVYTVLDLEYPRTGLINLKSMDQAIVQLRELIGP